MRAVTASVVLVTRGEPLSRVQRVVDAVAAQRHCGALELLVAAPPEERGALESLVAAGAVCSIVFVSNPGGGRSSGLNRAITAARGDVIVRVDARSYPPCDYVARCVNRLATSDRIGVVGGIQCPRSLNATVSARAIARALANPWMLGGATYRRRDRGGPADTAYLGAFRRAELVELGGFDESLDANEDFELCTRVREKGMQVWVEHGLEIPYEPRSRWSDLWRQYRAFGAAKVAYWRGSAGRPNGRQGMALAGATLAALGMGAAAVQPVVGVPLLALGVTGVAVVDHAVDPGERDIRVRLASLVAYGTILTGWYTGVLSALVSRPSRARRARP